jgi:hypothetical protein
MIVMVPLPNGAASKLGSDLKLIYNEQVSKAPDYDSNGLKSLTLISPIPQSPSASPEKQSSTYFPGVLPQIVSSKYTRNSSLFLPGSTVPHIPGSLESKLDNAIVPEQIFNQISLESMKLPIDYLNTLERYRLGTAVFGHDPNANNMKFPYIPQPYN